ncbi:hypothetical protein DQ04_05481010 [Trypanosoma grayi]|uniref:hypothetical protein n=1 Tax=Trypanosoma grayi TaxID=71804 RepID=UPI0004F4A24B|nr:hypothetical protein DQ04_05481010 [Trypanosoma grayi]KEG09282.1 hypothetical protein DQ04_05481010 [Trypanosoma grayi]
MSAKASGEVIVDLDPAIVYFTFSRIRDTFSCGRTIESTLEQFLRRELTPRDLPLLCVLTDGKGNYYSQNNRRLFLYKELQRRGMLTTVPVRLRQMPDTRRMRGKYTPEKCALHATLKHEGAVLPLPQDNCSEDEDELGTAAPAKTETSASPQQKQKQRRKKQPGGGGGAGVRAMTLEEELRELNV